MSLLAGIGQSLRGAMGGGVFPAATLHAVTQVITGGGEAANTFVDHSAQGFVGDWKAEVIAARGYDANAAKVILVQSETLPKPQVNDEVTAQRPINGTVERYRVTHVTSDPADATWQLAGVRV